MKPLGEKAALMPPEVLGPIRRRIALVIGISQYTDSSATPLRNLTYASADADAFAVHLMNSGFEKVRVLTDRTATLDNITKSIQRMVAEANKDDFLLISWAGHCLSDPRAPGTLYLAAHDTDVSRLLETGYGLDCFQHDLMAVKAERLVLILDTCHSGAIGMTKTATSTSQLPPPDMLTAMRGVYIEALPQAQTSVPNNIQMPATLPSDWLLDSRHVTMRLVFASSQQGEPSLESPQLEHGVFSYFLLKGLQGDADLPICGGSGDGVVTIDEVIRYTGKMVREYTRNHQNPAIGGVYDGTIPVGVTRK